MLPGCNEYTQIPLFCQRYTGEHFIILGFAIMFCDYSLFLIHGRIEHCTILHYCRPSCSNIFAATALTTVRLVGSSVNWKI